MLASGIKHIAASELFIFSRVDFMFRFLEWRLYFVLTPFFVICINLNFPNSSYPKDKSLHLTKYLILQVNFYFNQTPDRINSFDIRISSTDIDTYWVEFGASYCTYLATSTFVISKVLIRRCYVWEYRANCDLSVDVIGYSKLRKNFNCGWVVDWT